MELQPKTAAGSAENTFSSKICLRRASKRVSNRTSDCSCVWAPSLVHFESRERQPADWSPPPTASSPGHSFEKQCKELAIANSLVGGLLGFTQPLNYNSSPPQPRTTSHPAQRISSRSPMPKPIFSFAGSAPVSTCPGIQDSLHHAPHHLLRIVAASISGAYIRRQPCSYRDPKASASLLLESNTIATCSK